MGLARGVTLAGLVLALTACSEGLPRSVSPIEEGSQQSLAGEELLEALADGGLVLYLRHTETTDPALLALASTAKAGDTDPRRTEAAALALIATEPEEGTNTVLVGHVSNVEPVTGLAPEEGGTAVFRPDGSGRVTLVAEVPPQGWQRLAEEHG